MKHILSVSWGKDSLALLITLIKRKEIIDEVVFYDTEVEFEQIYRVRDKAIKDLLLPNNIKYTELRPRKPFMELMLNHKHKTRKGEIKYGYGWCGGLCRWATTEKVRTIDKYCQDSIQYVGIAYDEPERYKRLAPNKKAPLYDLGITEKQALEICYDNGYDYGGLYEHLDRVSCWCCRNKNLKEIRAYKEHYPNYYKALCDLEELIKEPMKKPKYLKERFGS